MLAQSKTSKLKGKGEKSARSDESVPLESEYHANYLSKTTGYKSRILIPERGSVRDFLLR